MISWLQSSSSIRFGQAQPRPFSGGHEPPRLEKVKMTSTPSKITAFAQFHTLPGIRRGGHFACCFDIRDEWELNVIQTQLAPHFEKVLLAYREGRPEHITLQNMKPESRIMSAETRTAAWEIVEDMVRPEDQRLREHKGAGKELAYYPVDTAKLVPYEAPGNELLQTFIGRALAAPGETMLLPVSGWVLCEDLKEAVALRFFAGFIPCLTLLVDSASNLVLGVELSGTERVHTVYPAEPRRKEPAWRINRGCLYIDAGIGFIYTVRLSELGSESSGPLPHVRLPEGGRWYVQDDSVPWSSFDHNTAAPLPSGRGLLLDAETIGNLSDICVKTKGKRYPG